MSLSFVGDGGLCYLIRHGETEWNVAGRFQGRADSPLTKKGLLQVEAVCRVLKEARVDTVYCSPLARAHHLGTKLSLTTGAPLTVDGRLAEIDCGDWSGKTAADIEILYPGLLEQRRRDRSNFAYPGGESFSDLAERVSSFLNVVKPGSVNAVVAHEAVNRMLIGLWLHLSDKEGEAIRVEHDGLLVLGKTGIRPLYFGLGGQ